MSPHPVKTLRLSAAASLFLACAGVADAAVVMLINPSDDGEIYNCVDCNPVSNGSYLLVSGYRQGIVKFPIVALSGPVIQAVLTINPYALPLHGTQLDIYGIASTAPLIGARDSGAGVHLGTWQMPANASYGEDIRFDVTEFVSAAPGDYIAFILQNPEGSMYVLSSLEQNYGHPSQLIVTMVPEPAAAGTVVFLLGALALRRQRRECGVVPGLLRF